MWQRMRKNRRLARSTSVEINLTPLIDTALTLLIIFMVTTPIMQNAIKINMPQGESKEGGRDKQELAVTIDATGSLFFNNKTVTIDEVGNVVKSYIKNLNKGEQTVWVRSDGVATCDTLMRVIDSIKVAGGVKDVNVALAQKNVVVA